MPDISIICPLLNEKDFIPSLAESLLINDGLDKELLFVDGGSTDGSREIIKKLSSADFRIKLVNNTRKYVNYGFNIAFEQSNGKYIAFLGAHTQYPGDYLKQAVDALQNNECDAVGGPLKQVGRSTMGKAIAYCLGSKFGVGNTEFRVYKKRMYVDSVAFAVYKREIFENIGLLDEDLIKNQDDEFHYRLNKAGYKILMIPGMQSIYYVRDNIRGLVKQYFNYGLFKPLVLRKIGRFISIRHFIPAMFVLYLLSFPLIYVSILWLLPLVLYLMLDLSFSLKAKGGILVKLYSIIVFPVLHISYGLGFLLGLTKS